MGLCECGQPRFGDSLKCKRCYHLAKLGLGRDATDKQIASTYRKLMRDCHPDRNKDKKRATERAAELNVARDVLLDGAAGNVPKADTPTPPPQPAAPRQQSTQKPPPPSSRKPEPPPASNPSQHGRHGFSTDAQPPQSTPKPFRPDYSQQPPARSRQIDIMPSIWPFAIVLLAVVGVYLGVIRLRAWLTRPVLPPAPLTHITACTTYQTPDACGCEIPGHFNRGQVVRFLVTSQGPESISVTMPDRTMTFPGNSPKWRRGAHLSCLPIFFRLPLVAAPASVATVSFMQQGRQMVDETKVEAVPATPSKAQRPGG